MCNNIQVDSFGIKPLHSRAVRQPQLKIKKKNKGNYLIEIKTVNNLMIRPRWVKRNEGRQWS